MRNSFYSRVRDQIRSLYVFNENDAGKPTLLLADQHGEPGDNAALLAAIALSLARCADALEDIACNTVRGDYE